MNWCSLSRERKQERSGRCIGAKAIEDSQTRFKAATREWSLSTFSHPACNTSNAGKYRCSHISFSCLSYDWQASSAACSHESCCPQGANRTSTRKNFFMPGLFSCLYCGVNGHELCIFAVFLHDDIHVRLCLQKGAATPMSVPRLRGTPAAERSPLINASQLRGASMGSASLKSTPAGGIFCKALITPYSLEPVPWKPANATLSEHMPVSLSDA